MKVLTMALPECAMCVAEGIESPPAQELVMSCEGLVCEGHAQQIEGEQCGPPGGMEWA